MAKVQIMDHPLIQHKIGIMRDKNTSTKEFRALVSEVAQLVYYDASRNLELADKVIETPLVTTTVKEIAGKKLCHLNGTTASTADIRAVVEEVDTLAGANGILLYLDEIQYFNKKQQQNNSKK